MRIERIREAINAYKMSYQYMYLIPAPKILSDYEIDILKTMFHRHGCFVIGSTMFVYSALRGINGIPFLNSNLDNRSEVLLFFTNQSLPQVNAMLLTFTGGPYPTPGCIAPRTVVQGKGFVRVWPNVTPLQMSNTLREYGVDSLTDLNSVFISKPYTVFRHGEILTWEQCEIAKLLHIRFPEFKLSVSHMWSKMGFRSFEPKRVSLLYKENEVLKRMRKINYSKLRFYSSWKVTNKPSSSWETIKTALRTWKSQQPTATTKVKKEKDTKPETPVKTEPTDVTVKTEPIETEIKVEEIKKEPSELIIEIL